MSGVQNYGRALKWLVQYIIFPIRPLPPYINLWHNSRDKCSQAFPVFHCASIFMYYTERKPEQERPENEGKSGESYHVIWDTYVTHCLH